MLKAINAEIVQKNDIVLYRGTGIGDDVFIGLIGIADASALSFGATEAAATIRRVCSVGANAIHLDRRMEDLTRRNGRRDLFLCRYLARKGEQRYWLV